MKVGYARVSTFEQNLDLQMNALEKEGCDRIFSDQGESGVKAHRPEWDNCLDHLRKGDTLVIWKLDRASRSTKHLIELAEDLKQRGVKLKSLKEQINTASAMGKFFFRMTVSIAELERDIIRERTVVTPKFRTVPRESTLKSIGVKHHGKQAKKLQQRI
ncbi:MAG: recombinase family protein [Cyanobacteria bacterium J06648_10]